MPDGRHLLFQRVIGPEGSARNELWRISAAGGQPQKLELTLPRMGHLRVHPDGRQIAFTAYSSQAGKSEVWVMQNFLPPPKAAP
jgi:hypothetical protein